MPEAHRLAVQDIFNRTDTSERARYEMLIQQRGVTTESPKGAGKLGFKPSNFVHIQQVVNGSLKPMAILNGALVAITTQPDSPIATPLTAEEKAKLLERARSVGRVEMSDGSSDAVLQGTAFVVKPGVVATNCHVMGNISERDSQGAWQLKKGVKVLVDFGDGPAHSPSHEFPVTQVRAYSSSTGLDVALLQVGARSADDKGSLPPPLDLSAKKVELRWGSKQELVGLVGYPQLKGPIIGDLITQEVFEALRTSNRFAKVYSPGAVTDVASPSGFDLLLHVASTYGGQSGSPLIDRSTFQVVGVHACCKFYSERLPPPQSDLPCSSTILMQRDVNQAISSWAILQDKRLAAVLLH